VKEASLPSDGYARLYKPPKKEKVDPKSSKKK